MTNVIYNKHEPDDQQQSTVMRHRFHLESKHANKRHVYRTALTHGCVQDSDTRTLTEWWRKSPSSPDRPLRLRRSCCEQITDCYCHNNDKLVRLRDSGVFAKKRQTLVQKYK